MTKRLKLYGHLGKKGTCPGLCHRACPDEERLNEPQSLATCRTDNKFLSRLGSRLSRSRIGISASSPHEDGRSRAEAECGGASNGADPPRVECEPVGSAQSPAGWVVDGESHVFRRRRYLPAMNRVDQTSMVRSDTRCLLMP